MGQVHYITQTGENFIRNCRWEDRVHNRTELRDWVPFSKNINNVEVSGNEHLFCPIAAARKR